MLACFATIIFAIPHSQAKNERDFSLSGVFTVSKSERMSVDMLSKIIFVNRNSIGLQHNQTTDIFQGSVEDLNKVIEKMEGGLEAEADDDDDE